MRRRKFSLYLGYVVALLTLLALLLLSQATEGSEKFERYYQPLLMTTVIGIICLLVIAVIYLLRLFKNYRQRQPGAMLSLTILWRTLFLAFIPLLFISFFAFKFLRYEFQSSFDEGINDALNNALVLSKKSLDVRAVQALSETHRVATAVMDYDFMRLQTDLEKIRLRVGAYELTVLDEKGFIQSFASDDLSVVIPLIPDHSNFERVDNEGGIFTLESDENQFQIRTLVTINKQGGPNYYLQAVFHIPDTVSALTEQVNRTITERDKFNYLMPRVNRSFIFVLLLVVLLAGLLLLLSSISFAGDMAEPIRALIQGTKRVSKGDFSKPLLVRRDDDLGTLMQSFNTMTDSLKNATEEIEHHRDRIESERAYLETVMNHITAGVVTLDYGYLLQTYNDRAEALLGVDLSGAIYCNIDGLDLSLSAYKELIIQVMNNYEKSKKSEIEVEINSENENKMLICSVTPLPSTDNLHGGYVIIFEVLGEYLQQQKQAAWEEVARRLAHEIKNPLTPILLATERLNYKLSGHLDEKQQQVLSRSVGVITNQVKSLKDMVNDFSDFAKPMTLQKGNLAFSALLKEIFELYNGHYSTVDFHLKSDAGEDHINGNAQVLRQVLHNLIKNAIEACDAKREKTPDYRGDITLSLINQNDKLILSIIDNGIGLPESTSPVFEPYVTTKEKGTGLGLAIVKKIIQAHQGSIKLKPREDEQGTIATISLPLAQHLDKKQTFDHEPATI